MTSEEDLRYGPGDDWADAEAIAEQEAEHSLREHVERIAEKGSVPFTDALALVQNLPAREPRTARPDGPDVRGDSSHRRAA